MVPLSRYRWIVCRALTQAWVNPERLPPLRPSSFLCCPTFALLLDMDFSDQAGGAGYVRVTVRTFAGRELVLALTATALVRDVKCQVKANWGVPVTEQKLVHMSGVTMDSDKLNDLATATMLALILVRGPAFHFDKTLAHPRIRISTDTAQITHSGHPEYQAAFLSDVLDVEGSYTIRFKLQDGGSNNFKEMYVGVAPDTDRNWSDLKGAYLNHLGILVDAFDESGWHKWRSGRLHQFIFEQDVDERRVRERSVMQAAVDAEEALSLDFTTEGAALTPDVLVTAEHRYMAASQNLADLKRAMAHWPRTCEFLLEVDMPSSLLRFLTVQGELVESLILPQLQAAPVRLCATLGYEKQTVSIVDA